MKYNTLGNSDIKISEWSLGCSGIGGRVQLYGYDFGWNDVTEADLTAAIRKAVDAGVNHFDVADLYGLGNAERRLADTLHRLGLNSNDFIISSKVGWMRGTAEHAYEPWHMRRQCEQSLRNLKRDYLDLYYLHNGDFGPDDRWLGPAAETLDELQKEGLIRLKGQSAYSTPDFLKTVPIVRPDVLQSRGNLLDIEFIAPDSPVSRLLTKTGASFVAFSPLAAGVLSDAFDPANPPVFEKGESRRGNPRFEAPYLARLRPALESLAQRFGTTREGIPAIAMRYILEQANVAAVLNGFQRPSDIDSSAAILDTQLNEQDIQWLNETFTPLRNT